jgi:hypothetical protein
MGELVMRLLSLGALAMSVTAVAGASGDTRALADPTVAFAPDRLALIDSSEQNRPQGAITFIGPGARSNDVVTIDVFVVMITPSTTVKGLAGVNLSYLRSTVSYDCDARTKQAVSITAFDPANKPTAIPIPAEFAGKLPVRRSSDDLSDVALPFACGEASAATWVAGVDGALQYAHQFAAPAAVGSRDASGPEADRGSH